MMNDAEWPELELESGVSREEHERYFAIMDVRKLRLDLLHKLQAAEHTAKDLLRRRGETNKEWFDRRMAMSGDEKAKVERVERTRWLRQDVSKTLRELRDGNQVNPTYPEVRKIVHAILVRQDTLNWRDLAELEPVKAVGEPGNA